MRAPPRRCRTHSKRTCARSARAAARPQLVAGFVQPPELSLSHSGHGFRPHRANWLKSCCFGGRNGEMPATARDSDEIECGRGRVQAICLTASEHRESGPRTETELTCDLQLHFATAVPSRPSDLKKNIATQFQICLKNRHRKSNFDDFCDFSPLFL